MFLVERGDCYVAHVEEGLGTKNLVADEMEKFTGVSYYDIIAQDTVAMILNDLATCGASPLSVAMHVAVGSKKWFMNELRAAALADGWARACTMARAAWGGGETPILPGIVSDGTVLLSGSATGIVSPKRRLIADRIDAGDAIVLIGGTGIHANGVSMARLIIEALPINKALPSRYLTPMPDGVSVCGGELLVPTPIYSPLVEDCLAAGIDIHYAVNITGHGWRKLMCSPRTLAYVVSEVPDPQPIFTFLQQHGPVTDKEMYGTFNMGAGYALFVRPSEVDAIKRVISAIPELAHLPVIDSGRVENGTERKVIIKPKGVTFGDDSLQIR